MWTHNDELVTGVAGELGSDFDCLNSVQRTLALAWHGYGLWSCGGFEEFLQSDLDAAQVARALRNVGLPAAARAFTQAAKHVPRSLARDREARERFIEEHREQLEKAWERAEKPLLRMEDQHLTRALARYIRAHPDEIQAQRAIEVDDLFARLDARAKRTRLRPAERTYHLAWSFYLCTSVEGLSGAFSTRLPLRQTAHALTAIGVPQAAALLRRAETLPLDARNLMDPRIQELDAGLMMIRDRLRERAEAWADAIIPQRPSPKTGSSIPPQRRSTERNSSHVRSARRVP